MDASQLEELKRTTREYDFVRFTWADLYGIARGETITGNNVNQYLEDGLKCCAGMMKKYDHK